jgi:hypothetical protein
MKAVKQLQQEIQKDPEEPTDEQIQSELLAAGSFGVKFEPQLRGPVTIASMTHSVRDMLELATVLNLSEKNVIAIRLGWLSRNPNQADEAKISDWIIFPKPLKSDGFATISAQKIDPTPYRAPGTLVKFYIAQVRYEDGSLWERTKDTKDGASTKSAFILSAHTRSMGAK